MNEPQQPQGSGWDVGKVLVMIISLAAMVGFGLCGLFGLFGGLEDLFRPSGDLHGLWVIMLPCGAAGVAIAFGAAWLMRKIVRDARGES